MPTLTITRGLPGAGKTTWARGQVGQVRVNRDDLRRMLHGGYDGSGRSEKQVTLVHRASVESLLNAGHNVICDDTNLRASVVRELAAIARGCGAAVVIEDFTGVPVDECVARDAQRPPGERVGEHTIRDMHTRYLDGRTLTTPTLSPAVVPTGPGGGGAVRYRPPAGAPPTVLVDIDGTVALLHGRSPYDMTRVSRDRPNHAVIAAVRAMHAAGHLVVFCSGRTEEARVDTLTWLEKHVGVPFEALYLRAAGDGRKDSVVKAEIFEREIRARYNVVGVFDDRAQVVKMWRALGLTVFQVAEGDF